MNSSRSLSLSLLLALPVFVSTTWVFPSRGQEVDPFIKNDREPAATPFRQNKSDKPTAKAAPKKSAVDPSELFTKKFVAPPALCLQPQPRIKSDLELAGIDFGEGASVIASYSDRSLIVRNTAEQLTLVEAYLDTIRAPVERQLSVVHQLIRVEADIYRKWRASHAIRWGGAELWNQAREWIQNDHATLLDTSLVTARSGNRSKTESILEVIYPTEVDPAEVPEDASIDGATEGDVATATNPAAYETRNVGHTLEVDPVLGPDNHTINLNLAPESVHLENLSHWPPAEIGVFAPFSIPVFEMTKVSTQVTTQDGDWVFLGSCPAREEGLLLLRFVRCDVAHLSVDPRQETIDLPDEEFGKTDDDKPVSRSYHLSSGIVRTLKDSNAKKPGGPAGEPPSFQTMLEGIGILFPEGTSAKLDPSRRVATVINTEERLRQWESRLHIIRSMAEAMIHLNFEWLETDLDVFSEWLAKNRITSDAQALRLQARQWEAERKATVIRSADIVARSGQRSQIEAIEEYVYPTEFDPAEISKTLSLKNGAKAPITPVTPTALETRNLGTTVEVDPVLGRDRIHIDLNVAPEMVELAEVMTWPARQTDPKFQSHTPVFYTQRMTTQLVTRDGRHFLLGTTRPREPSDPERKQPIILLFVRPDVSTTMDWTVEEN